MATNRRTKDWSRQDLDIEDINPLDAQFLGGADLNRANQLGDFSPIGGDDVYQEIQGELEQTDPNWRSLNPRAAPAPGRRPADYRMQIAQALGSGGNDRWTMPEPWGSDRLPSGGGPRRPAPRDVV